MGVVVCLAALLSCLYTAVYFGVSFKGNGLGFWDSGSDDVLNDSADKKLDLPQAIKEPPSHTYAMEL